MKKKQNTLSVSRISDERATMLDLPRARDSSLLASAQLLSVTQPALLHRAVLIMNVTNIFRINASYFSIFHCG